MVHHYKHYPHSVAVYSLIYAEVANMQNLVRNIEAVAELSASFISILITYRYFMEVVNNATRTSMREASFYKV